MIFPPLHNLIHPLEGLGYQFWSGIGSDFGELTLVTAVIVSFITAYRHIECHRDGCHRLGRFTHGHLKLCHVHHPLTPDDGKITDAHVKEITCP